MHPRRAMALACALSMLLGQALSGAAAAKTEVIRFTAVGPGVQALWEYQDGEHIVATNFLAFHQLNAPGTQGYFQEVLIIRTAGEEGDTGYYSAIYDTYGGADPAIVIREPLAYASVSGRAALIDCVGACEGLPSDVGFAETWTGTGAITRIPAPFSENSWFILDPGVMLDMSRGVEFTRPAGLGSLDPFDGAFGPLGTLSTADPGVRFFDVHTSQVFVCHPGGC